MSDVESRMSDVGSRMSDGTHKLPYYVDQNLGSKDSTNDLSYMSKFCS